MTVPRSRSRAAFRAFLQNIHLEEQSETLNKLVMPLVFKTNIALANVKSEVASVLLIISQYNHCIQTSC